MTDDGALTDQTGKVGLDKREFDSKNHVTSVGVDKLKQAIDILDVLGWEKVDLYSVNPPDGDGFPMLQFRTPDPEFEWVSGGGISVAPLAEAARETGGTSEGEES